MITDLRWRVFTILLQCIVIIIPKDREGYFVLDTIHLMTAMQLKYYKEELENGTISRSKNRSKKSFRTD